MSTPTNDSKNLVKDNRKIMYGILTLLLLGTWGYIIYDKSSIKQSIKQKDEQILIVSSEKDSIQLAFNNASSKLDSLAGANTKLQGTLAEQNNNILKLKKDISGILGKRNASEGDLKQAKELLADYENKISSFNAEIKKLKEENLLLSNSNTKLTTERDSLNSEKDRLQNHLNSTEAAKKTMEDLGSTLHASNLSIVAIDKKSDGKEKETTAAKRADFLRFAFDLDENRVATSGSKELFICITGPDGKSITDGSTFNSRDEGAIVYTAKVTIDYEQGKRTPVKYDWKKDDKKYPIGNYKISIYQNGFKIGEGVKTLKKAGLFG